jgi:hypothetical protein
MLRPPTDRNPGLFKVIYSEGARPGRWHIYVVGQDAPITKGTLLAEKFSSYSAAQRWGYAQGTKLGATLYRAHHPELSLDERGRLIEG